MDDLFEHLELINAGPISDSSELGSLLSGCWEKFDGSNAESMKGDKLSGRMKNVRWEPPILTFDIDRHGGTVMGSSRAEVHGWEVDTHKQTAICGKINHRQCRPMAPRLNVVQLAEEIAGLIVERKNDEQLRWNDDGSVRVLIGKVLPEGSAVKATLAGRRKRFREAMKQYLEEKNWRMLRANEYAYNSLENSTNTLS